MEKTDTGRKRRGSSYLHAIAPKGGGEETALQGKLSRGHKSGQKKKEFDFKKNRRFPYGGETPVATVEEPLNHFFFKSC